MAPDESAWGLPYARFDFGSSCDAFHFHDHQIIFDLTLCGDCVTATLELARPPFLTCDGPTPRLFRAFARYWPHELDCHRCRGRQYLFLCVL